MQYETDERSEALLRELRRRRHGKGRRQLRRVIRQSARWKPEPRSWRFCWRWVIDEDGGRFVLTGWTFRRDPVRG
jgi:hypothetical protein